MPAAKGKPRKRSPKQTPDASAAEAQQLDGVLVTKDVDEEGNITTGVQTLGKVQPTEVQTLLELGLDAFRKQIGLSKG